MGSLLVQRYAYQISLAVSISGIINCFSQTNVTSTNLSISMVLQAASDWLYVYPRGIEDLLLYTKRKYNDPLIYITENGNYLVSCIIKFSHVV